ncbi:HSP20 family protein [Methylomarinovum tepidoasis]|uniref:HSP20 family protein n=1 Tax=Methylomarinovum tepidoasis TaxID=2840183 RepID=A0AAU9C5C9_9GAMM|nr:Hsp20/alpha crystallin family protein [Methylomarinovum sp. IN45]BCX88722.1 HSP20 family protein [Methylomarinovum sp. IN45]
MALVPRYEPFQLLNQLQRELERTFGTLPGGVTRPEGEVPAEVEWVPAVDIKEEQDRYIVQADLPGVKPEDIEVTLENGVLTIKGQRMTEAKEEKENYRRVERIYGSFFRRFVLPETVDEEKIEAKYDNGVLTLVIPKKAEEAPKKIEVKVGG